MPAPAPLLNEEFQRALKLMKRKNLFITGKAGVGKSTLLKVFCTQTQPPPVVLAPTGVAALNVKGQTIHRFFQFRPDVTVQKIRNLKNPPQNPGLYRQLQCLIIDEVSMVRADLLDCVDVFLKKFGPVAGRPFGGVQMIFIGDLYQIPPVLTRQDQKVFSTYYDSPFFFSARAFQNFDVEMVELQKVYRQKDHLFIQILNRVRENLVTEEDLKTLNTRHVPGFRPPRGGFFIHLSSRNKQADAINARCLRNLPGQAFTSRAEVSGEFQEEVFPTHFSLQFKKGTQVMLLNNDSQNRWVNGSVGRIREVLEKEGDLSVRIQLQGGLPGEVVEVSRHTWRIYRFALSPETKKIVSEEVGTFTQLPFRLAWAITIHKSQGKTLDRVMINSEGIFSVGMAYVALSRCTSLKGLTLTSPLKRKHIQTDSRVVRFLNHFQNQKSLFSV